MTWGLFCLLFPILTGVVVGVAVLVDVAADIRGIRRLVDDACCRQIDELRRGKR